MTALSARIGTESAPLNCVRKVREEAAASHSKTHNKIAEEAS